MDLYMRLKENLKHYLALREMSAAALSRASKEYGVHVPKATISNWLAGGSVRNLDSLYVVSRILRVTVDELLFSDPTQRKETTTARGSAILDLLIDHEEWVSGVFEVRLRRVKHKP